VGGRHAGFGGVLVVAAGGYLLQVAGKSSGAPTIRAVNSVATLVTPMEESLLSSSASISSLVKNPILNTVTKLPKESAKAAAATTTAAAAATTATTATTAEAAVTIEDDDDRRKPRSRLARLRTLRLCGGGGTLLGSIMAPLRALVMEEGSLLMLSVAALWSVTSSLDKMGSQMASSFMVFAAVQRLWMAAPIVLYLVVSRPSCFLKMAQNLPVVVATSLSELLVIICFLKVFVPPVGLSVCIVPGDLRRWIRFRHHPTRLPA
jgi:hypothetical protein